MKDRTFNTGPNHQPTRRLKAMNKLLTPIDYDKLDNLSSLAESIEDLAIGLRENMLGANGFSDQDFHAIYGGLALITHAARSIHGEIGKQSPGVSHGN